MGEDTRTAEVDGGAIARLRKGKLWTQEDLACAADVGIDTVKRAEGKPGYRMRLGNIKAIADAFGVEPVVILGNNEDARPAYTWDRILAGAEEVAKQAFSESGFCADALLTFPAASSIFASLVLVRLPLEKAMRLPVYTAIFKDKDVPGPFPGFELAETKCFNVLVPKALFEGGYKNLVVVEDTIISGGAMDKLRELLESHLKGSVKFACCICHDSLAFENRTGPEILGLPELERRKKFPMPWGIDSYRYEEVFCTERQRSTEKTSVTITGS